MAYHLVRYELLIKYKTGNDTIITNFGTPGSACYGTMLGSFHKIREDVKSISLKLQHPSQITYGKTIYNKSIIDTYIKETIYPYLKKQFKIKCDFDDEDPEQIMYSFNIPVKMFEKDTNIGVIVHYICDLIRVNWQFPKAAISFHEYYHEYNKLNSKHKADPLLIFQMMALFCLPDVNDSGHMPYYCTYYTHPNNNFLCFNFIDALPNYIKNSRYLYSYTHLAGEITDGKFNKCDEELKEKLLSFFKGKGHKINRSTESTIFIYKK